MKTTIIPILLTTFISFAYVCNAVPEAAETDETLQAPSARDQKTDTSAAPLDHLTWPRFLEHEKGTLKIYQPQVEKWEKEVIQYRMAIEIHLTDRIEAIYGALWLKAATDTRLDERLVQIKDVEVSNISIPSATPNDLKRLAAFINETVKGEQIVISLDHIIADVAHQPESITVRKTKTDMNAPGILYSQEPALLLMIEGDPVLQPIADTGLSFVANANMDLFYYDNLQTYYLFIGAQWLSTTDLDAVWENNITPPDIFNAIPDDYERAYVKDLLGTTSEVELIVLRTQPPAELILTDGPPTPVDIPGTGLSYVKNTEQDLFLYKPEGLFYYMSSGRWFKSKRLKGPWLAVGNMLPQDFKKIPDDHPMHSVLETVRGTPEAKEAVVESQIPRKITVRRNKTSVDVKYHGDPEFKVLKGTHLAYAANTTKEVFKLGPKYYCCYEGVWFVSKQPDGSWEVCDTVPDKIYDIPATSPKYYVTFVFVYEFDEETVTFGYTSGYTGTYVSERGTVVQGTGEYYASYTYYYNGYPYYYWGPCTYWYWGYDDYYYGGPYYYYPYHGHASYHHGRYGSGYTYHYGRQSLTKYSGSYKGVDFKTEQYRGPYGQWGESEFSRGDDWVNTWHKSDGDRTVGGIETSRGGKGFVAKGDDHQGGIYKSGDNNLYVGKDGNIYRRDEDGWSKREPGGWNPVSRDGTVKRDRPAAREGLGTNRDRISTPTDTTRRSERTDYRDIDRRNDNFQSSRTYGDLNSRQYSRERGNQRTQQHYSRSSSQFGGRSGGMRGGSHGGGRGRR